VFFGIQDDGKSPEKFCEFSRFMVGESSDFWVVMPCRPDRAQCFRGTLCLHVLVGLLFEHEDKGSMDCL
jgi:hypothetical protein